MAIILLGPAKIYTDTVDIIMRNYKLFVRYVYPIPIPHGMP